MTDVHTARLPGKVALVTGGSSGIGAATARAFAAQGAAVVIAARHAEGVSRIVDEITAQGGTVLGVPTDVSSWEACEAAVAATVDRFGHLDLLVNAAGVMFMAPVERADPGEWVTMMQTNVLGSMFMVKLAIPHLLRTRGTIVQLSSAAGRVARVNTSGYCASKWAVGAFCEAVRQEVGDRGVRVVVVEAGSTNTQLRFSITDQAVLDAVSKRSAGIEQLEPEDVADVIVYSVTAPARLAMNELLFRPTEQTW